MCVDVIAVREADPDQETQYRWRVTGFAVALITACRKVRTVARTADGWSNTSTSAFRYDRSRAPVLQASYRPGRRNFIGVNAKGKKPKQFGNAISIWWSGRTTWLGRSFMK